MMGAKESRGFTLIELMIVVLIIGVLAAIAYPNYSQYVLNSRRAAAAACMHEAAQFMERFHTTTLTYAGAALPAGRECEAELAEFYQIGLDGAPTATTYTIQATRIGPQLNDTRCGDLSLNQVGAQVASTGAEGCF